MGIDNAPDLEDPGINSNKTGKQLVNSPELLPSIKQSKNHLMESHRKQLSSSSVASPSPKVTANSLLASLAGNCKSQLAVDIPEANTSALAQRSFTCKGIHQESVVNTLQSNFQFVSKAFDEQFMRRALSLAARSRVTAPPNPWVGCVIVRNGVVIGEGFHRRAGLPHAEVEAIADALCKAGVDVQSFSMQFSSLKNTYAAQSLNRKQQHHSCDNGSTSLSGNYFNANKICIGEGFDHELELVRRVLNEAIVYVTLEPCHHVGRTGPCDEMLIRADVKRVVVSVVDPDPRVSSRGLAKLSETGIEVVTGICQAEGEELLKPYLHQRKFKRPYCIIKVATSMDGRVACQDKSSKWITGPSARQFAHVLRAQSQAILCGVNTAIADNPSLTVRLTPRSEAVSLNHTSCSSTSNDQHNPWQDTSTRFVIRNHKIRANIFLNT